MATQRKAEGGKKGRQSKQRLLGMKLVSRETQPKKRQPRAKDKVAAATGVPREVLTVARKVRRADPEIAEKAEQGKLSLKEVADAVGLVRKKQVKPSVPKPAKTEPIKKSAKGKPAANQSPWHDKFTELIDTPDGVRTLRCEHATFYIHTTKAFSAVVIPDGDGWRWHAGTDDDQGSEEHRKDAEKNVLDWCSMNCKHDE